MNKKSKSSRPRTTVRSALRGVELPNPCVMLIKQGTALANKGMIDEVVKTMNRTKIQGMVVVVDSFDDLSVLNADQMKELGWRVNVPQDYDTFRKWLEATHPDIELLPWQDEFARAYLNRDAEMLLAARASASGKTFISDLLKEFKEL